MQLPEAALPILVSDDHYWLKKLIDEFYFSHEEAKYLKDQMRGNYEDVYHFCEADTFEIFDRIMIYSVIPNYSNEIESIVDELRQLDGQRGFALRKHLNDMQYMRSISKPIFIFDL